MHAYFGNPIMPGTLGKPTGVIKGLLTYKFYFKNAFETRLHEINTYGTLKNKCSVLSWSLFSLKSYKKYRLTFKYLFLVT